MQLLFFAIEILLFLGLALFIMGYMIFKIIPLSIRLLRIRIRKAEEYIRQEERKYKHRNNTVKATNKGPYGTGWTWNEKKQLWEPPGYKEPEIKIKRSEPDFEEWKAEKLKKEINSTPPNTKTEQGTYRYDYIHVPDEEPRHYHHNDTILKVSIQIPQQEQNRQQDDIPPKPIKKEAEQNTNAKFKNGYEAKPVLTQNEMRNYRTLIEAANRKGYTVSSKMRLADLVKPRNEPQYYARFRKISQYHVDFVVLDGQMRVKAVIELDDSSHDTPKRRERDQFIDEMLTDCGIKIIHTRHITPDILDKV